MSSSNTASALPVVQIGGKAYRRLPDGRLLPLSSNDTLTAVKQLLAALAEAIDDPEALVYRAVGDGATTAYALSGFSLLTTDDLTVSISGTFQQEGYTLSSGTLTFDAPPPETADIFVSASTARIALASLLQAFRDLA